MASGFVIRKNQYYDSVFLMSINRRISDVRGVQQSAVLMGSPANKQLLLDIGIQDPKVESAGANDLIVAAIAETDGIVTDVLGRLDDWLNAVQESAPVPEGLCTLEDGLAVKPNANLAVISVPGEYAAREARKALEAGLHVFLFSDNVSIDDELDLKQFASRQGLLVMGPDCGTSLIGGVGIGFANAIRKGSVGVIGAAGTGLQEFTCQVHNAGYGISHAIGTGSRDLSEKIGGLTTFAALEAMDRDQGTEVIAMISKPPSPAALGRLLRKIESCHKPVIGCFLGAEGIRLSHAHNFRQARTIDDAVWFVVESIHGRLESSEEKFNKYEEKLLGDESRAWSPDQKYLRGILAGGTFCYQTQQILLDHGIIVHSNSPIEPNCKLDHPDRSIEHTVVDMGDDFYMVGRPHPMIDGTMRKRRILAECQDPQIAVLYLDFILGYNASMDPVGELVDAIRSAKKIYRQRGGSLTVLASICGTDEDPQDLKLQEKILREAGVLVYRSNARAAAACCRLLANKAI
jgi:FdrA protein